jgi:hypothetical protein
MGGQGANHLTFALGLNSFCTNGEVEGDQQDDDASRFSREQGRHPAGQFHLSQVLPSDAFIVPLGRLGPARDNFVISGAWGSSLS